MHEAIAEHSRAGATERVSLLGVEVDALTMADLHQAIASALRTGKQSIIANHNLHSIYLYHHDARFRAFYAKAQYIHVDGMSLVFLSWMKRLPLKRRHRVTYADWLVPLMEFAAAQNWRVFYLGSAPGVADQGADILRKRIPQLQLRTANGFFKPFDRRENSEVLNAINEYRPDLLLVGMGMPRQEHWIADNQEALQAGAILNCGAAMDYVAGAVATPPRAAARLGFEWLFRLLNQPRQLWRRYLLEPFFLMHLLFKRSRVVREDTDEQRGHNVSV
jgi:N-acetylglucosaminyldiphosphoundecaprenol N-acetyl-beta-D-mannosaminyltransferase